MSGIRNGKTILRDKGTGDSIQKGFEGKRRLVRGFFICNNNKACYSNGLSHSPAKNVSVSGRRVRGASSSALSPFGILSLANWYPT